MNFLEELAPEQRELIISLPYKVGLWLSHVDDTGGDDASQEETQALENILKAFNQDVFGSEALQYIMAETINQRDKWDSWSHDAANIPQSCQKAIDILHKCLDEKEVNSYKQRLLEIAEAVALAFREYDSLDFAGKIRVYIMYYSDKIKARTRKHGQKSLDQYLNISIRERKALDTLAHTLGVRYG